MVAAVAHKCGSPYHASSMGDAHDPSAESQGNFCLVGRVGNQVPLLSIRQQVQYLTRRDGKCAVASQSRGEQLQAVRSADIVGIDDCEEPTQRLSNGDIASSGRSHVLLKTLGLDSRIAVGSYDV